MKYRKAKQVKIGDILHSKDSFTFNVSRIEESTNAANTEKYIIFHGNSTRGYEVYYNHKQIIG